MGRKLCRLAPIALVIGACDGSAGTRSSGNPAEAPSLRHLVSGPAQLVGEQGAGCSQQSPGSGDDAETWCAFFRPGSSTATELWTLDVSRAIGDAVSCDGTDPRCLRLTSNLWTGTTIFSPAHPEIHGFEGRSLIFYADAQPGTADDPYIGPVRLWRPGWETARVVTTGQGYVCYGQARAAVAFCLDSVVHSPTNVEFDLLAGSVADPAGGPLPKIDHIRVAGSQGQLLWGASFSPGGDYLGMSSPAVGADLEVLRVAELDNGVASPPVEILADAPRWQISADGSKVYFLKDFGNHTTRDEVDRWGTLTMADFPSGANSTVLADGVPGFLDLGGPGGPDRGVAFIQDTLHGAGTFHVIRDRTNPRAQVSVESGVEYFEMSPDLNFAFLEEPQTKDGTPEGVVARTDGKGACAFTVKPGYPVYHPVFLPKPRLIFWGDEQATGKFDLEGYYTDPETCNPKHRFSPRLAYVSPVGDGILYGDYGEDRVRELMTLKHARLTGTPLEEGGGEVIGENVDVRVLLSPGLRHLVFTVSRGDPAAMGLYTYGPLP